MSIDRIDTKPKRYERIPEHQYDFDPEGFKKRAATLIKQKPIQKKREQA